MPAGPAGRSAGVTAAPRSATAKRLIAQLAACEVAGARVLPAARAMGARRRRPLHAREAPGRAAARRRARGDRARRAGAAARPLPARARARAGGGPLVVRRARSGGASRLAGRARPRRRGRVGRSGSRSPTSSWPCSSGRSRACASAADIGSEPDRSSLWAGLFDLRENLLGRTLEDLRATRRLSSHAAVGDRRSRPSADTFRRHSPLA